MRFMRIDGDTIAEVSIDFPATTRILDQPERTEEVFASREEVRADGTVFVHPPGIVIVPATYVERPTTPADVGLGLDWITHDGAAEPGWVRKGRRWVAPV